MLMMFSSLLHIYLYETMILREAWWPAKVFYKKRIKGKLKIGANIPIFE